MKLKTHSKLDKAGATASFLCAIHCALMPLVITQFPIIGLSFFASETMEWLLFASSAGIGVTSLCFGYTKHKSKLALAVLSVGLTFLAIGRILHEHIKVHHTFDVYVLMLVIGGFMVACSHFINHRLCHSCTVCHHEHAEENK